MEELESVGVVQQLFEAFGAGDDDGVLALLTEDVEFRVPTPPGVPYKPVYRGPDEVGELLGAVAAMSETLEFEPLEFIAQGDTVVVLLHEVSRIKSTGKRLEQDFAQVWTVRDGRISACQMYEDTYAIYEACREGAADGG